MEAAEGRTAVLEGRLEKLLDPQNPNKPMVRTSMHGAMGVHITSLHKWDMRGYSEDENWQAVAGSPHLSLITSCIDNATAIRPGDSSYGHHNTKFDTPDVHLVLD